MADRSSSDLPYDTEHTSPFLQWYDGIQSEVGHLTFEVKKPDGVQPEVEYTSVERKWYDGLQAVVEHPTFAGRWYNAIRAEVEHATFEGRRSSWVTYLPLGGLRLWSLGNFPLEIDIHRPSAELSDESRLLANLTLAKRAEVAGPPDRRTRLLAAFRRRLETTTEENLDALAADSAELIISRLFGSVRAGNEWDEAVGPFYDDEGLLRWLPELTLEDLRRDAERDELLVVYAGETALYPVFQFDDSGQPLPGLKFLLPILRRALGSHWDLALWLTGRIGPKGETAAQMLQQNRVDFVLDAATKDAIGMTA